MENNARDSLISRLSEIRSQYNCFNEPEEPYYRALSEVINMLSEQADGDTISRQAAIDAIHPFEQLDDIPEEFREVLRVLKEKFDIAKEMRHMNKPLEYALCETWQEFRRRNEVMR